VSISGRRGVTGYYPRRAVKDGHAWMFPGCSQELYRRFLSAEIFESLFMSNYVGRVGFELTTGGL
jgi:hypothetical protein